MDSPALPIDARLAEIAETVRARRALVLSAPPGAGKTTRVPPALAVDGPVIVLQPRRVAARSIARRIADEQGWTLGREVGWHVRFERKFGEATRVLVATEGILTARLQQDPLLSTFRTVILDEFHERTIHADLGLALARQAWLANHELRIVVMSATLDTASVSRYLDNCTVIDIPGRLYPIDVSYHPGRPAADAVAAALAATNGNVLCFLPGAPEIGRALSDVRDRAGAGVDVYPLHGSLDSAAQDDAIRPVSPKPRVILATNIAETSLTVPGVTAVVDAGLQKVARYDPDRVVDSLETERISVDSAEQRAGRAGRLAPGIVLRLWDARDRLRPHREPEIARVDLASTVLDLLAWGAEPRTFEWFEAPSRHALEAALELLDRLGAIETSLKARTTLTPTGDGLRRLPIHPRLGRLLIEANGSMEAARACALISERHFVAPRSAAALTSSDLLSAIDGWAHMPPHVQRIANEIARMFSANDHANRFAFDEEAFLKAVLAGYPDRVAQRRAPGSPRVLLASGHGAVVGPESGVRDGEFLVAVDVTAGRPGEGSEARVRLASRIDRQWLQPTVTTREHTFDLKSGTVRAVEAERYGALVLAERFVAADRDASVRMLAEAFLTRGLPADAQRLVHRLRFASLLASDDNDAAAEVEALVRDAASRAQRLDDVDLASSVPPDRRKLLERLAPETLTVPSGRAITLDYRDDGGVAAAVKLQELFGLAETPRIGPNRVPLIFELLAPNGRPVQVTRDLRSFWDCTYPEVRRELRARYPKHPWPEDPWTAPPTSRTVRRRKN
ncbi:MAG TPA: ATP-dependent helicase HrpB [Vicinamibacterales bacterium]|jgi:ATP-dependent helicase HrpB|nr:ATP-dependent helicase HrpB [Vicinamibacterales bacterium]